MRKGLKITIGIFTVIIFFIAFMGFCYFWYLRNSRISQADTYDGERLMYAHKTQDAINMLEKALIRDHHNIRAENRLLDLYFEQKQYRNVIDMQTSQMKDDRGDYMNFVREKNIAKAHVELGEIKEAKEIYESLLTKYHDAPSLYMGLAKCYEKEGNLTEAIKQQERAIEIMKNNPKYTPKSFLKKELEKLAQWYKQTGQEDQANKLSQEISAAN